MKTLFFFLTLIFISTASFAQATNTNKLLRQKAAEICKKFMNSTYVDEAITLCNLPFAIDQNEIVTDTATLKKRLNYFFRADNNNKAERTVRIKKFKVISAKPKQEILYRLVPINVYIVELKFIFVRVMDPERSEIFQFAVQMTGEPKIIGIGIPD